MNITTDQPTSAIDVERLWVDSVFVTATTRDWDRDTYGEAWEVFEAPDCDVCGYTATYDEDGGAWVCGNEECDDRGKETDAQTGDGPMMNYSYDLPDRIDDPYTVAAALRDLPLCLVYFTEEDSYALALTGGGMDLSWEICEAFMRLGYLPPARYADLPGMAGYPRNDDQRAVVRACARTFVWLRDDAARDLEHLCKRYPEVFDPEGPDA